MSEKHIDNSTIPIDEYTVTWKGSDDPENPMNFSKAQKICQIALISLITMLSPFTSTIVAPATADILLTFNSTNETLGAFITSIYLLGYVFGPLLIGPLSEIYGRWILYNTCNVIFFVFNIACALAPNAGGLIAFRFFAGIAASCPLTLGAGSIADMIPRERRGLAMAAWVFGPIVGPTFAPVIGSVLAQHKGWRWVFWLVVILAGITLVLSFLFLKESYPRTILARKTKRVQKETGNTQYHSALESKSSQDILKTAIFRPLTMLFFSPIIFLLSLYLAVVYGYLYLLFTTFPRVFVEQYHFSPLGVGLTYLGTGVGSVIGVIVCAATSDRIVAFLTKRHGQETPKPEYRLPLVSVGGILIVIGLFLYAWTAQYSLHFILPIIGTSLLGTGLFMIMMPVGTYFIDIYTRCAASASAASTVFRSLLGALLPLIGNRMYDALGVGWGTSLLGFIALAFVPLPMLFYIFGERLRIGSGRQARWAKEEI